MHWWWKWYGQNGDNDEDISNVSVFDDGDISADNCTVDDDYEENYDK